MIPVGWEKKYLSEVADYKGGRTPARANAAFWPKGGDGIPWVAISDMPEFGAVLTTKEKVSKEAFEQVFRGQVVPAGTLLMSFKLTIGRVARLGIDACHNEAIISIFPRSSVDQRFLGYYLGQVDYDSLQDRQIKGNTLNREKIDRIEILLPPLTEQLAIAHILETVRDGIERQVRGLALAEELKHATMRTLFTCGLRGEAQKETEIGMIPSGWKVVALGAHYSVGTGGTPARDNPTYWEGGTIPWVKTTEIDYCVIRETEEHITEAGLKGSSARILPPGTVLLAMYGQGVTRGKLAILGLPAACNQACAAITGTDDAVDGNYLYYFLTYRYEAIRQLAHGGQQQNLNLDIVRAIPIALPPDQEEQREIVTILHAIDKKIDLCRRKREVLEDLFRTLRHKLMMGEIRITDLDLSCIAPNGPEPAAA